MHDYRWGRPAKGFLLDHGIEVDVTVKPGLEELHRGETFGAYATAPSTDFRDYPRRPYYPSRSGLDRPAISADEARPMLMSNDSCRSYLLCAVSCAAALC